MTILSELCEALGWHGGTIHEVLAEIHRLKAYEEKANAYEKRSKEALALSGRVAITVSEVERSNVHTLSQNTELLLKATQEYDQYIIQWSSEEWK